MILLTVILFLSDYFLIACILLPIYFILYCIYDSFLAYYWPVVIYVVIIDKSSYLV